VYIDYVKDYGANSDDAEYVDTIQQEVSFSAAALFFHILIVLYMYVKWSVYTCLGEFYARPLA